MDIKILNDITLQASHKKHHFLSQQCINQPPDWANDNKHVCLPWPVATGALAGFASTSVPSYESAGQLSSRDWACFCVWGGLLLVQRCLLEQWKNCSIPFYPPPASQPRHAVMVWAEEWGPEPAQCQWHLAVFGLHHVCQQPKRCCACAWAPSRDPWQRAWTRGSCKSCCSVCLSQAVPLLLPQPLSL